MNGYQRTVRCWHCDGTGRKLLSPLHAETIALLRKHGPIHAAGLAAIGGVTEWIAEGGFKVVNCAGNSESGMPGIGAWAEAYLGEVFRITNGEGGR